MKVVILAAGYATRLYPLTLTTPKPLLKVAGRPMIDYVMDNLAPIQSIDHIYVVTNARFADKFFGWADRYQKPRQNLNFSVVNDGSTSEENKLGAIGDLQFVLERQQINDDTIVIAADNLLSEDLGAFGKFCQATQAPVVGVYDVQSLQLAASYNSIQFDASGRIFHFEEKPERCVNSLIAIAMYYYPKSILPMVAKYIAEGNNPDQPGRLVQWLYLRTPFFVWQVPGIWYDIGSKETLELANRAFTDKAAEDHSL
jgi:glucose-1-phosphate thymidylyltransferase